MAKKLLPLRLEWRKPEELRENPANWRVHSEGQTEALSGLLGEVGWAGAALYNERTKRLIDGHLRKKVPAEYLVDGKIPVLVGRWTEAQEKLILATLDPLAAMAEANQQALGELLAGLETESAAVEEMLAGLAAEHGVDVFAMPSDADGKEFDESVADDVERVTCPKCGHEFPK